LHNRKNALFAGHDEGGIAWGRIASLIETCKINDVEPFAYIKATLTAIAAGHPKAASTTCSHGTLIRQAKKQVQRSERLRSICPVGNQAGTSEV